MPEPATPPLRHTPLMFAATTSTPTSGAPSSPSNAPQRGLPVVAVNLGMNYAAPALGPYQFTGSGSATGRFNVSGTALGYERPAVWSFELQAAAFPIAWAGVHGFFSFGGMSPDGLVSSGAATAGGAASPSTLAVGVGPALQGSVGPLIARVSMDVGLRYASFTLAGFPPTYENRCHQGMCRLEAVLPIASAWGLIVQPRASLEVVVIEDSSFRLSVGGFVGAELFPNVSFTCGASLGLLFGHHRESASHPS